jgi:hypothetical protein
MIIIWGQKLYGRVDRVPGHFYVATRFFHLWYIPLIPLGSWIVLEGTEAGDGWRGASIGVSLKSTLFGWFRGACIVFAIAAVFMSVILKGQQRPDWWRLLIPAATAATLFFFTKLFEKASADRAFELAHKLGLPPEMLQALEEIFQTPGLAAMSAVESALETPADPGSAV